MEIVESVITGKIAADRIDREKGIVRGVKLVGMESPDKRRRYSANGLREAVSQGLYEGKKAYIDHPSKDQGGRSYRDSFGFYESIEFRESQGVFGNLRFNPKHSLAEQFCWDAEHATNGVGLSHVATANKIGKDKDGWQLIESLKSVSSVDVVSDPATTKNLFESKDLTTEKRAKSMEFSELTIESIGKNRPDLLEQIKKAGADEATKPLTEQITQLAAFKDGIEARERLAARQASCRKLCTEAKLPDYLVTDVFVNTLVEAKDESHKLLIEDRAKLAINAGAAGGSSKGVAQSVEQRLAESRAGGGGNSGGNGGGSSMSTKDFVARLKS